MKQTYMGTTVDSEAYRAFAVAAAQRGTSKAGLLRQMVHEFAAASKSTAPTPKARTKKGVAA